MKRLWKYAAYLVVLAVIVALIAAAYRPVSDYFAARNRPQYRTSPLVAGDIVAVVNASGTVRPVMEVTIGSFVSGPIDQLYVGFNERVYKGQQMARIDTRIYDAAVARDRATLDTRIAEKERTAAQLELARRDESRANNLRQENPRFISQAELDQFKYNRMALDASLKLAIAGEAQARANLETSEANLRYTLITSPVDGIVIDRKIEPGQTLAAQFQTPELFKVAQDMDKVVHIHASVDEADIGYIRDAQQNGLPVHFTVDAYPDELFEGRIAEVRFSSATEQNVVTYPVIVLAQQPPPVAMSLSAAAEEGVDSGTANSPAAGPAGPGGGKTPSDGLFPAELFAPARELLGSLVDDLAAEGPANQTLELVLLPGMTANLSFQVDSRTAVLKVPNAALRFYPDVEHVHPDDRKLFNGQAGNSQQQEEEPAEELSAKEKADARRKRNRRHIWIQDGQLLRAVEVITGLSDNRYTEIVEMPGRKLKEGDRVVTGIEVTSSF